MTPKQRAFAEQYALDHNGAAAAIRAGYAVRSARQMAHELLAKADVQRLVAEYEAAAADRLAVSRERVIAELKAAIAIARERSDPMAMIRGWVEIGKMIGAYAPERRKLEVSVDTGRLAARIQQMSDAELLEIIEKS